MKEAETIRRMLENADIIVTARADGFARRCFPDDYRLQLLRVYSRTWLSASSIKNEGSARTLIACTHEAAGRNTTLILLAAPTARTYYPRVGMLAHDSCWFIPRTPTPDS